MGSNEKSIAGHIKYHYLIFHFLGLMDEATDRTAARTALALILSFACAALSFSLLERPILQFKDRWRPPPQGKRPESS